MFDSSILLKKRFPLSSLHILHSPSSNRTIHETIDNQITYQRQRALETHSSSKPLRDGLVYRIENLHDLTDHANPLLFKLTTIPYRYIHTAPLFKDYYQAHPESRPNFLSTAGLFLTTDNTYIFGKRTHSHTIDFIGGCAQPDELVINTGNDIERNILKELWEETGIPNTSVTACEGIGLLFTYRANIIVMAEVTLGCSSSEALKFFNQRTDNEMEDLVFVDKDNLPSYLHALSHYRPLVSDLVTKGS